MIRVLPRPEPDGFDERVRQRGRQWLSADSASKPRPYWLAFKHELWLSFGGRCGYSAMYDPTEGSVDHFFSVETHRHLAYEWTNYRFASTVMNQRKRKAQVLDPFVVQDDWFEVLLPSLQLVITDNVPAEYREFARATLKQLRLVHDEQILRQRQGWLQMYREGKLSLEGLRQMAPMVARAVEKQASSSNEVSAHKG